MTSTIRLALLALLAATGIALRAPEPTTTATTQLSEVEKVRLVLLPAVVTTRSGRPVLGLGRGDFRLREDGRPEEIDVFSSEVASTISLAFLLDVSGSMGLADRRELVERVIRAFLEAGRLDRFGLLRFSGGDVEWVAEVGANRGLLLDRLREQSTGGRTALFDALAAAGAIVGAGPASPKAVVVLTDGDDNASGRTLEEALSIARRLDVPIYLLSLVPTAIDLLPERVLESLARLTRFAEETGGRLYAIHAAEDIALAVAGVRQDLSHQYLIGYYPDHERWDGSFRAVELVTVRRGFQVRARKGYYATP